MVADRGQMGDSLAHPKLAVKNCFIRGSVVRYVKMGARSVDTTLLEDATRRGKCMPIGCGCEPVADDTENNTSK
jgi:hypothetical protein